MASKGKKQTAGKKGATGAKSGASRAKAPRKRPTSGKPPRRGGKGRKSGKGYSLFDHDERGEGQDESDLPKDEAGRRKIKRQYETLLGIRIEKLKGRILNRERINKTIEGVYFICAECKKVCHNMDDGLVEDPDNVRNLCGGCAKPGKGKGKQAAA